MSGKSLNFMFQAMNPLMSNDGDFGGSEILRTSFLLSLFVVCAVKRLLECGCLLS